MNLSNLALEQDRLNVKSKSRSNIFPWRGQFTPQFVEYLLSTFAKSGDIIIDPFSGSGTVLHECVLRGLSCYGYEINPAAYAMSKFFTLSNISIEQRKDILSDLKSVIQNTLDPFEDMPLFRSKKLHREKYANLIEFSNVLFSNSNNQLQRLILVNMLFIAESRRNRSITSAISNSFKYIKNRLLELPYTNNPICAKLCDSRLTHVDKEKYANVVVTSPPYINVFNYHQNYRAILETLGWDLLRVAKSEIGSNRKNRGNRFKTVIQYCLEIEQTMQSLWKSLADESIMVFVVGRESKVRGISFYNGAIIKDILNQMECFEYVNNHERHFINRFGAKIKEDIIVARKTKRTFSGSVGKNIAIKHLEKSIPSSTDDVRQDIKEAISQADETHHSPFLNRKEIFLDA